MSIDLARTLHENVDSGPAVGPDGTSGIDLDALTARVRRRRTRRAVTRGAVGVGAAGVFAFAGVQVVGRRGPDDVLPAADPAAAPGSCGAAMDRLGPSAGVATLAVPSESSDPLGATAQVTDPDAGVLAGRALTVTLSEMSNLPAWDGTEQQATTIGPEVNSLVAVDTAGTIVGTQPVPTVSGGGGQLIVEVETGAMHSVVLLEQALTTCGPGGTPAGTELPDGVYSLYALSTSTAETQVLGGPWDVRLEPPLTTLTDLPADYPASEVPVVGDALITAVAERGSDPGWLVRTETDSIGALDSAAAAIRDAGGEDVDIMTMSSDLLTTMAIDSASRVLRTASWEIVIRLVEDADGPTVLQYQLAPR